MLIGILSFIICHVSASESPRGLTTSFGPEAAVQSRTKSEESSDKEEKSLMQMPSSPSLSLDFGDTLITLLYLKDGQVSQMEFYGRYGDVKSVVIAPGFEIKAHDTSGTVASKSSGDETLEMSMRQRIRRSSLRDRQFDLLLKAGNLLLSEDTVEGHLSTKCRAAVQQALTEHNENERRIGVTQDMIEKLESDEELSRDEISTEKHRMAVQR